MWLSQNRSSPAPPPLLLLFCLYSFYFRNTRLIELTYPHSFLSPHHCKAWGIPLDIFPLVGIMNVDYTLTFTYYFWVYSQSKTYMGKFIVQYYSLRFFQKLKYMCSMCLRICKISINLAISILTLPEVQIGCQTKEPPQ